MLKLRMKIIEGVLGSADADSVERAILEVIQQRIDSGISIKRIMYTIPSLEFDILFQIRVKQKPDELKKLIEALRIFKDGIIINNTILNKNKL